MPDRTAEYAPKPGRCKFDIGHLNCCWRIGHPAGWCDRQPFERAGNQPMTPANPDSGVIDTLLTHIALEEAIGQLNGLHLRAVNSYAEICSDIGVPPRLNDPKKRDAWQRESWPLWLFHARMVNIPVHELSGALWPACEQIATLLGWQKPEETDLPEFIVTRERSKGSRVIAAIYDAGTDLSRYYGWDLTTVPAASRFEPKLAIDRRSLVGDEIIPFQLGREPKRTFTRWTSAETWLETVA